MGNTTPLTNNKKLLAWVDEMAKMCQPDQVVWCDGSQEEYDELARMMVKNGAYVRLCDERGFYLLLTVNHYKYVLKFCNIK